MGERSSVDSAVSVGVAVVGGVQLYRVIQRLRHRATHPTMEDPGKDLMHWLQLAAIGLAAISAISIVGLFVWLGPVAFILAVVIGLVAIVAWAAVGLCLWLAAERRRRAVRYVICEADYADAPRQIKSTMRRIYRSAESVQSSPAHHLEMFGDLSVTDVVYSAAERAILSSELAAGARDLRPDAQASDQTLLDDVNEQIRAIKDELAVVDATFKRSAKSAEKLSQRVSEPERRRATEQAKQTAAAAASDRRERARAHLEEVSLRVKSTPAAASDDVMERIDAVAAGYDEATHVSNRVLNEPSDRADSDSNTEAPPASTTRDTVAKAAKFTASAAKWSVSAAKSSTDKFKK